MAQNPGHQERMKTVPGAGAHGRDREGSRGFLPIMEEILGFHTRATLCCGLFGMCLTHVEGLYFLKYKVILTLSAPSFLS